MDESPEGNRIDSRVGGLVWVRRRNGSWWPGRIMGLEELPESCLVSPRSGTPVKLLGREDGSIDWYNLERSKRVKAFRCGEYEDAIEKAKAAAANLSKKAVKYARREDAILHALRLERSCSGKEKNGIPIVDPRSEHHIDSENDFTLMPELSQSGLSFQEPSPSTRRRTSNDSAVEDYKRMRGLENLACGSNNPINGFKDHSLPLKRKRSQLAVVHDYLKRKDRRRPLTKVLESTAMVSTPHSKDQTECPKWESPAASLSKLDLEFHECNGNGSIIVDMSNFNGSPTDWENALQTDGIDDVAKTNGSECPSEYPENEDFEAFSEAPSFLEDKNSIDLQQVQLSSGKTPVPHLNGLSVELNQVNCAFLLSDGDGFPEPSPHSAAVHSDHSTPTAERGTTEWSSKGKRNSRQLARKQSSLKYFDLKEEPNIQSSLQTRESPPLSLPPSFETDEHPVRSSGSDSALYDVNLEVKSWNHRPPHVPLVSLMSKLTGKAVIGHPLSVEALDDGKSDILSSSSAREVLPLPIPGASETVRRNKAIKLQEQRFSSHKSKKRRKRGGALSKKMRKLSSLTGRKGRPKSGKPAGDKTGGPVVACIPVKVVFSRISEGVNGSTRSSTTTMPTNKV